MRSMTALWLCAGLIALPVQALEVSPPDWWVGMQHQSLQLMVEAPGIASAGVTLDYPGVRIDSVERLDSDDYLFVNLQLDGPAPGSVPITFITEQGETVVNYALHARKKGSAGRPSFTQSDTIYLVTPDRFANGDLTNDTVEGYQDTANRAEPGGRHGGDIQGMINHLDYLKWLGVTQLWSMPLLENAMPAYSYHGYSITDYYRIDPRFGSNDLYRHLSEQAAEQGIGLIMDMVLNHIGSGHPWMNNPPSHDWIHNDGRFTPTTHRREALHDPHAAPTEIAAFNEGWFVPSMPDLNQRQPMLANYLIQNAIWWVEYAGLSGIRVDTYSYSDRNFLSEWTRRITQEYPNLNIVGEEWSVNPLITSYWQRGSQRPDDYVSYLPSVMDFPLQAAISNGLKASESWSSGLRQLYEVLASDFVYGDPYNLVVFADNHDMSRIYTQMDEDLPLWNMAMTLVLTSRGIPQLFYGTEILMNNPGTDDHGIIRTDFPGGWPDDLINGFTRQGLSDKQLWAMERIRSLLALRKAYPRLLTGELTQYGPEEGVYVYFRHRPDSNMRLMVVLNKNDNSTGLPLNRYGALLSGMTSIQRVGEPENPTGGPLASGPTSSPAKPIPDTLTLEGRSATVWLLSN